MPKPSSRAPHWRFLFEHPAHLIACGFGSGLSPLAPGTAGTLFAWLSFPLLSSRLPAFYWWFFLAMAAFLGVLVIERAGKALGEVDHGCIVWDEIVPFWGVLSFCPPSFLWQTAAFALFRFFDIYKLQPARFFDQHVKNGWGVMADDLVAAAYSVACLKLILYCTDAYGVV